MTPNNNSRCHALRQEARARKRLGGKVFHQTETMLQFDLKGGASKLLEVTHALKVSDDGFRMEYVL